MTGLGIRLYTDEDVDTDLAPHLRRRGYDALSCLEAGNANRELPDEWQLDYAVHERRAILTHNIADFVALDRHWKEQGRKHFGIVLASRKGATIGQLLRRLELHLNTASPESQFDVLRYLTR